MWVSACVSLVTVSEIGRLAFLSPISLCESSEQRGPPCWMSTAVLLTLFVNAVYYV